MEWTEQEWNAAWDAAATVRDGAPRRADDAPTDDVIAAVLDALAPFVAARAALGPAMTAPTWAVGPGGIAPASVEVTVTDHGPHGSASVTVDLPEHEALAIVDQIRVQLGRSRDHHDTAHGDTERP